MNSYLHEYINVKDYAEGMLTLHEVGEIIRMTALRNGLIPMTEWRVIGISGHKRDIDWVWLDPTKDFNSDSAIVAAFEIDAPNMPRESVAKALDGLGALTCKKKYQVLYHIRKFKVLKYGKSLTESLCDYHNAGIEILRDLQLQKAIWE